MRCLCCKEIGHTIENCFKDPNFRTDVNADEDMKRIANMPSYKKLHVDSMVCTAHLIKKSVMVPILQTEGKYAEPENIQHPFMRGIMTFDDYNYQNYNDLVLLEDPGNADREKIIK